ncbi:hypothetical protein VDGL01_06907 [Verticillium dahliae]
MTSCYASLANPLARGLPRWDSRQAAALPDAVPDMSTQDELPPAIPCSMTAATRRGYYPIRPLILSSPSSSPWLLLRIVRLPLSRWPVQVPTEEVHQPLGNEDLFNRVQQQGNLDQCHGQVVGVPPHGGHQRDAEARRLGGAAEANGDRLITRHAPHAQRAAQEPRAEASVGDAGVDGPRQSEGRPRGDEAQHGEEGVQGEVHEDGKDDARGRRVLQGAGVEGAGEGRPDEEHEADARQLGEAEDAEGPGDGRVEEAADDLAGGQRQQDREAQLAQDAGVHGAQRRRARGLPGRKGRRLGEECEDERRREEGAEHVAENDLDDGGRLVAAGGARHDHVGGNRRRQARRHQHADEDARVEHAVTQGAGGDRDVQHDQQHDGDGDKRNALHEQVEAPVGRVLAQLDGRQLEATDEEDDGDGAVDDAVLGADGPALGRDVCQPCSSAFHVSFSVVAESRGEPLVRTGPEVRKQARDAETNDEPLRQDKPNDPAPWRLRRPSDVTLAVVLPLHLRRCPVTATRVSKAVFRVRLVLAILVLNVLGHGHDNTEA